MLFSYPPLLQSSVGPKDIKVNYAHLSRPLSLLLLPNYFLLFNSTAHPFLLPIKLRLTKDTISC